MMLLVLFEQITVDLVRTTVGAWGSFAQYPNSSMLHLFFG